MTSGIATGTRLGPYEIVGWIGAGGMGEVYRARDTRLGRDVALKLIPAAASAEPSRIRRFEQEARAAAAIAHPNILAVYDVGVQDGVPYIVSELLEGESLRSRLRGDALPVRKAIDIGRYTADGLAAAHDKGIVHRDVKPDNIFITADGRVKILDFGIAKLNAADGEPARTGLPTETNPGAIVGTAGYMSPEQIRGETVDARSDIFSLGAVLYEMMTGRAPFTRETAADTMAAILNAEPSELEAGRAPAAIALVIARCLEKSREARYQSARDLAFGLEMLSGTNTAAAARIRGRRRIPRAALAGAAAAVAIASTAWLLRPLPIADPLANATFSRFTDWPGEEGSAQISPDGKSVVFLADKAGEFDVWQSQIGSGNFINLTDREAGAPAPNNILSPIGFSADGTQIWIHFGLERDRRIMVMPFGGGPRRVFLGTSYVTPGFSPDGRVAYVQGNKGDPLFVARSTGENPQQITTDPPTVHTHNPVWSADAQWIYFVHGDEPSSNMDVWRVRPDGSSREQITALGTDANSVAPLDERTLLFTARAADLSGPWLWSVDVPSRTIRRAVTGLERYTSVSASRDGSRIVATVANPKTVLWSVPILDQPAAEADARPYAAPVDSPFAPRFAGASLYYLHESGAASSLWRVDEGGAPVQIWNGMDGRLTEPVAVSNDGRIAMVLREGGRRRLVTLALDGTNPRTISEALDVRGATGQCTADWSPDGNWIVTGGADAKGEGLFKIPANGGTPIRLVTGRAENPVWSPDGTLIVYSTGVVPGSALLKAVSPDGTPMPFPEVRAVPGAYRFTPGGRQLVYLRVLTAFNFSILDLQTKQTRLLTQMQPRGAVQTFDVTADGKSVVFDRTVLNADIFLIERPRPGSAGRGSR